MNLKRDVNQTDRPSRRRNHRLLALRTDLDLHFL